MAFVILLVEGDCCAAFVVNCITIGPVIDEAIAAHLLSVVKSHVSAALVVLKITLATLNATVAALVFSVVEGDRLAALVVHSLRALGSR